MTRAEFDSLYHDVLYGLPDGKWDHAVGGGQFLYWSGYVIPDPAHIAARVWYTITRREIESCVDEGMANFCHADFVAATNLYDECVRLERQLEAKTYDYDKARAREAATRLVDSATTELPKRYNRDIEVVSTFDAFRQIDTARRLLVDTAATLDIKLTGRAVGSKPRNFPSRPLRTNGANIAPDTVEKHLESLRSTLQAAPDYTGVIPQNVSEVRAASNDLAKHRSRVRAKLISRLVGADRKLAANRQAADKRAADTQKTRAALVEARTAYNAAVKRLLRTYASHKNEHTYMAYQKMMEIINYPTKYGLPKKIRAHKSDPDIELDLEW